MKKYILEISLALGLCASLIVGALALDTQRDISCKLIRLHIIANSDSNEDQSLKLKVRDAVLERVSELCAQCRNITEAEGVVRENILKLEALANEVISENGFSYRSRAELSEVYFPTRRYDTFSLPAGRYNALRIHLGDGDGKNWWCVLFPPVCVSAAEAESEFYESGMTEDEMKFITSSDTQYKFKFKLLEIIGSAAEKLTR